MSKVKRINTSQVEGSNANNNNTSEIRPYGEIGLYQGDYDPVRANDRLELLIFDGKRTYQESKVLSPGVFYGSNADSGDGLGLDTIKLIPDATLGSEQYLIVDPTAPNHIHLRAGGTIDNSSAELFIGGEKNHLKISDTFDNVVISADDTAGGTKQWTYASSGDLTLPSNGQILSDNVVIKGISSVTLKVTNALNPLATRDWSFSPNGHFVFPDSTVQTTAFTGTGTITFNTNTIRNTTSLGGQVNVQTASQQGDPAKTWSFDHNGGGSLILTEGSSIRAKYGFNILATDPSFVNFTSIVDFDSNSSAQNNDITILNPQASLLNVIDPASPNCLAVAGAKIRILHQNGQVYVRQLTSGFTLTGTDPGTGLQQWSATIPFFGGASLIKEFSIENSANWNFKPDGLLTFPDATVQTTAWAGGRVVSAPTSSTGTAGNKQGDIAFSNGYIYYCTANYVSPTYPSETFTVTNVGEFNNTIQVLVANNPNYTVPQAGWTVTVGTTLMTLSAFSALNLDGVNWNFLFDNSPDAPLPSTVTITSPTPNSSPNIWKRVAWSGDIW